MLSTTIPVNTAPVPARAKNQSPLASVIMRIAAAAIPTIIPAMLLVLSSLALVAQRPGFVRPYEAAAALGLNVVALISTFVWQRPIQGRMAQSGYDEANIRRLIATNWIRTIAHWLIAILATTILMRLIEVTVSVALH